MYIINHIRLYSHRRHTYRGWRPIYVCCLRRLYLANMKIINLSSETHSRTKYKDKCVHGNQIAMVIVKSKWLNLRLLVSEG